MNEAVIFWLLLAVILFVVESATLSLVSIWAALAAMVCAVLVFVGVSNYGVSVCFVLITALFLISTRPFVKKYLNSRVVPTNADRIIGLEAEVVKAIGKNSTGQINVKGAIWTAASLNSEEIKEGMRVIIISIEGVKAIVKEI